MSRDYAIRDLDEAKAYLAHPILGPRLITAAGAVLAHSDAQSAETMLGGIDAIKLRSSATLFEAAGGNAVFGRLIDVFYEGTRDPETLRRI